MKKHHHILTLMVLSVAISLCIILSCKPQRGGVDTGTPCGGADARLASGQGGVAKVPLNVYSGLSYGAQMTWANNKVNNAAPTIHSCASVVSLEEENGELVAYVATAYHCVRNMAEQHVSGTVNEYALYFNIASDADCQTTEGKKPNYVKVDFDINKSEYLSKLAAKIQNLKSQNPSINIAQHDRAWLEKSLSIADPHEKQMLEDLKGNFKLSDDTVNEAKLFNESFDSRACTASPSVATSHAKHLSYEDFHHYITPDKDSTDNVSNACFLSNDVVFLKMTLNKTILNYESTHKCLKTSHLTTEMSNNNKPVPLTLNIGSHPQNQSEWSRAVVSFHDEALQWDSQEQQQSREWRTAKHHQNLFNNIMDKTFHKSTDTINQGTESKDDDLIVNFQEIIDYSQDQRHLRLLTFYKDGDNDPYQFKRLKLSYSKNQPQINAGFMELYGSVYAIILRKWGISLILSGLNVHPGSSGSLIISGNETIGYEIMAALYSKGGKEYSTAHGPIDKADYIGQMTPKTDTTQPSDDDNDEKRAYSGAPTSQTPPVDSSARQSTTAGDTEKREPQTNKSADLKPNPQPVDKPNPNEDESEVAEEKQVTNNQPQQQEEKDDDKNRENFYNIRDTSEDDVRARDFGCN